MWKVPKGQGMGKCHGAAHEESARRAIDEGSAEANEESKCFVEGNERSEGPKRGNNWSMLPEGADRILDVGV